MTFFIFWYKWVETIYSPSNKSFMRNLGFIKENGLWYADLPEFLPKLEAIFAKEIYKDKKGEESILLKEPEVKKE